jgi:hypothetical protein
LGVQSQTWSSTPLALREALLRTADFSCPAHSSGVHLFFPVYYANNCLDHHCPV